MKIVSILLAFFMAISTAHAKDYRLYLPSGPGSLNDVLGRSVAQAFNEQNPNDRLIVENRPGGDMIVAYNGFASEEPGIIFAGVTLHVFNYFYREGKLPYSDKDFDHSVYLGYSPQVWYAKANSDIKTPQDLIKVLPTQAKSFVGLDHSLALANLQSLRKHYKAEKITEVRYKTATDVMTGTISGEVLVGIGSPAPALISNVQAGNLIVLGTTMPDEIELDGVKLPSISRQLKMDTFSAASIISISPRFSKEEAQKLHKALAAAVKSDTVQQAMKKVGMIYDGALGVDAKKKLDAYRDKVAKLQ